MRFFDRILGRETRSQTVRSSDPYLSEFFGQGGGAGAYVDPKRATGLATAHACISSISQSLASMPLHLNRTMNDGGSERATDHPLYSVLHDLANDTQTAFELRELMVVALLTSGNAYAEIIWNGRGQVTKLVPIDPSNVSVERLESGRLRYRVTDPRGGVRVLLQDEMLHLRYRLAPNGVMGLSPIQIARETFGLALSQADTQKGMTEKSFRPSGAFVFPNALTDEQYERAQKGFQKQGGAGSAGKVILLDGGVDFKPFSIASKDAEFLESRKLSNLDVCRVFGVPPTSVGILDHGTYSNVESEAKALVIRCLAPMAKRIEQAMNAALLPTGGSSGLSIEHDLQGLLRGDVKSRFEAYRIGREWGWMSPNDIRALERMKSLGPIGDEYATPLNMVPLGERPDPEKQGGK